MDAVSDPLIPQIHKDDRFCGGLFTKTSHHDTYVFISPKASDLSGRTVLVSGASYGIGQSMAVSYTRGGVSGLALAARGDLSETISACEEAAKSSGIPVPRILPLKIDVADQTSVESGAAAFVEKFPEGLDILVNNAGYLEPTVFIAESDPMEWWKSLEINLKGPYLMSRSFIPQLLKKQDGLKVLCNITSIGGLMLLPGMSAYNTAKHALHRLTEYQDVEYAVKGLMALTLHPGGVKTHMGGRLTEEKMKYLTDTPELPAYTVVWLTKERKEWLRGRYVSAQWDMAQLEEHAKDIVDGDLLKVKLQVGEGFL